MQLKIKEGSIDTIDLRNVLAKDFENKYKVSKRGKHTTVIAKNNVIGALVFVRKNKVLISANFSTIIAQIIFLILVVVLGFIIPILLYFLFFYKKMKLVEKDVANSIQNHYSRFIFSN